MPKVENVQKGKEFRQFDIIGAFLSVAWPLLFTFAIQEGGSNYKWNSSIIIGTVVGGVVGLVLFVAWEIQLGRQKKQEPILPMRLLTDPITALVFTYIGPYR